MKISLLFLWIAKLLPRGGFKLVKLAAHLFEELQSFPIQLNLIPDFKAKADLRESVWYPLWRYGHYPHQIAEDMLSLLILRQNDIIWDIGANIGYTALIFARAVGPGGLVFAFEPSNKSFEHLKRTVGEWEYIHAVKIVLSDFVGTIRFADSRALELSAILGPGRKGGYIVKCITLDEWFARGESPPPDFIKIDVEGHEASVIRGARQVISQYLPIILFEALTEDARINIIRILRDYSCGNYLFYSIRKDVKLVPIEKGLFVNCTNNYVAISKASFGRLPNAMNIHEHD